MRRVWQWWKRVARRIGDFQARLILLIFYFVVLAPFALILRLAADPLAIKKGTPKGWVERRKVNGGWKEWATRQF
jgi:hypothetical protein